MIHSGEHWIGRDWITPATGRTADAVSPATGEIIGSVALGGEDECRAAIASARAAFDKSTWSQNARLRAAVLFEVADRIAAHADLLAPLLAFETGKLIVGSRAEIAATVSELRYYAGLTRAIQGRMMEVEPGAYSLLMREAAGVVGVIVPWNSPGILLARSVAPALAAGCAVVVKPALQSSLFHTALMRLFSQASALPPGVVNSFCETGSEGAAEMVRSPDVDVLSFTGSSAVGKKIMAAAAPTVKRVNLELGGKAAAIVFEDCDVSAVAPRIVAAALIQCGQQCTAINRVLVHESKYDEMRRALGSIIKAVRLGRVDDETSELGPLISASSRDRVAAIVAEANSIGQAPIVGRQPAGALARGAYLEPSLLTVSDLGSSFIQEEFFGPVVNLESFADETDAIARANATRYGLSASVWTKDLARAHRVARALRSGTVWLNDHNRLMAEAETGGYRESGLGRLHGLEGLNDFLETKHIFQSHGTTEARQSNMIDRMSS